MTPNWFNSLNELTHSWIYYLPVTHNFQNVLDWLIFCFDVTELNCALTQSMNQLTINSKTSHFCNYRWIYEPYWLNMIESTQFNPLEAVLICMSLSVMIGLNLSQSTDWWDAEIDPWEWIKKYIPFKEWTKSETTQSSIFSLLFSDRPKKSVINSSKSLSKKSWLHY